jgi:acyl carrier protein
VKKILEIEELIVIIREITDTQDAISLDTDLSKYIQDSIDLGELIAIVKHRHGIFVQDTRLFNDHILLKDVLKIFNHEIK